MTSVFVSGAIANKANNGGNAWAVFSWVTGLRNLGIDVVFVEQIDPRFCVDALGRECAIEDSVQAAYFRDTCGFFGMAETSAMVARNSDMSIGLPWSDIVARALDSDLLVNITGHLEDPVLLSSFRRKAYLDFDPGFTQMWQASGVLGARLEGHDVFFTLGTNIGNAQCSIPHCGIDWHTTLQPVVLADWPRVVASGGKLTSVATWRPSYGRLEFEGRQFGLKLHEFRKIAEIPARCPKDSFELCLDVHEGDCADVDWFRSNRWGITSRDRVATPNGFRAYVQDSRAELSSAQPVYVETNSGWFSDRSVRYLASGKPVIVQDTGFATNLPTGEGLFAYRTPVDIVDAVAAISADYDRHANAARSIAENSFDADSVVSRFLEEAGV